jgi:UDP-GlcNAc:undecaprenyl-phosphate GlcNAc-1-phosphate transferase
MTPLPPTLICILAIAWLILVPVLSGIVLDCLKLKRTNFQGREIPTGFGLAILLWSSPLLLYFARFDPLYRRELLAFAVICAGFGLLGFLDDLFGDRKASGIRGHFRKFFIEGEFTTGFVKAVGGVFLGVEVLRLVLDRPWSIAFLEGAVIALCANAINLLDLRPGRACVAFLLPAAVLIALHCRETPSEIPPLAFVFIPTLLVCERDARAKVMLGDTGSNLLGAAIGLAFVKAFPAPAAQAVLLAFLLGLHLLAERYSISAIIAQNSVLRRLDSLTGKR